MRNRIIIIALWSLLASLLWNVVLPQEAAAYAPYTTEYKDSFGEAVRTQMAYLPSGAFGREIVLPDPKDSSKLANSPLQKPQDLFIDGNNRLYIADTGNNRIVVMSREGELLRVIEVKESPLSQPQGLFVDKAGLIYVADTGNHRVVKLDPSGKLLQEFKRPESKFLPDSFKYDPVKLVVDKRGFLYVATLGGYQGLLQLKPDGGFQSFFGASKTAFSVADAIKRVLYTREMYLREIAKLPGSITSVTLDNEGFIYTVTKEVAKGQVRKHNIAGLDMLASKGDFNSGGARRFGETFQAGVKPQLNDLTVDSTGNITVIDAKLNVVSQYDANGNLLFYWGSSALSADPKLGIVKSPTAVASDSDNNLYILDGENNLVQAFRLSEFGALVHQANRLTQDGRYEEGSQLWEEVLRLNAHYTPALLGLAKAAFKQGNYGRAKELFREAGHTGGYSEAYWQARLEWFQQYFGRLMTAAVIAFGVFYTAKLLFLRRQKRFAGADGRAAGRLKRLAGELKHAFYILRHPIDGFIGIRYEGKAGLSGSIIILLLSFIAYGVIKAGTGFVFNPEAVLDLNLLTVWGQLGVLWLGWVVCNYLVSTIYKGEGRFRDVVYGSAYALFPLVPAGIPITLLSNVLTLNEASIFHFLQLAMYLWVGLLLFWKVQSIQNYSVGETVVNMSLSVLTMAVCGVLLFIVYVLTSELFSFIYSIYQEVSIR
jgi:Gluconolactonase